MNETSMPFANKEVIVFLNGSDKAVIRNIRKLKGLKSGNKIKFRFTNNFSELLDWFKK